MTTTHGPASSSTNGASCTNTTDNNFALGINNVIEVSPINTRSNCDGCQYHIE